MVTIEELLGEIQQPDFGLAEAILERQKSGKPPIIEEVAEPVLQTGYQQYQRISDGWTLVTLDYSPPGIPLQEINEVHAVLVHGNVIGGKTVKGRLRTRDSIIVEKITAGIVQGEWAVGYVWDETHEPKRKLVATIVSRTRSDYQNFRYLSELAELSGPASQLQNELVAKVTYVAGAPSDLQDAVYGVTGVEVMMNDQDVAQILPADHQLGIFEPQTPTGVRKGRFPLPFENDGVLYNLEPVKDPETGHDKGFYRATRKEGDARLEVEFPRGIPNAFSDLIRGMLLDKVGWLYLPSNGFFWENRRFVAYNQILPAPPMRGR